MTTVLELNEIKRLIDTPQLLREIESGFVLYSEDQVVVPPVGFLHFDQHVASRNDYTRRKSLNADDLIELPKQYASIFCRDRPIILDRALEQSKIPAIVVRVT